MISYAYTGDLPNELKTQIELLESTAINFSYRVIKDAKVRHEYINAIRKSSHEVSDAYRAGLYSAKEAAELANSQRNQIMELMRSKTSQLGTSAAINMKEVGRELSFFENKYAKKNYGKSFHLLSRVEKNHVYMEIVNKSGIANNKASRIIKNLGKAGRMLMLFSIAATVYDIYGAKNKAKAVIYNGVVFTGGAAGSSITGAMAGMACGPGAVVCVSAGIILGGIAGTVTTSSVLKKTSLSHY